MFLSSMQLIIKQQGLSKMKGNVKKVKAGKLAHGCLNHTEGARH